MSLYSYEEFEEKYRDSGVNMSDADYALAKKDPDFGVSLIELKKKYAASSDKKEKASIHDTVEKLRQDRGGYSGGITGSDFIPSASQKTENQFEFSDKAAYDDALKRILNREKFTYDLNADALYGQYRDKYLKNAKLSALDVAGNASAQTGGYGSSYGEVVASQAYGNALSELGDRIPELYELALKTYNAEGDALADSYGLLSDRYDDEYKAYRDGVEDSQWREEQDEKVREALAEEEYKNNSLDETIRSNKATEAYKNSALDETIRSNKATEAYKNSALDETIRSNKESESLKRDTLAEDVRAALAEEALKAATLEETKRKNQSDEAYKNSALAESTRASKANESLKSQQLEETTRHNKASEGKSTDSNGEERIFDLKGMGYSDLAEFELIMKRHAEQYGNEGLLAELREMYNLGFIDSATLSTLYNSYKLADGVSHIE